MGKARKQERGREQEQEQEQERLSLLGAHVGPDPRDALLERRAGGRAPGGGGASEQESCDDTECARGRGAQRMSDRRSKIWEIQSHFRVVERREILRS